MTKRQFAVVLLLLTIIIGLQVFQMAYYHRRIRKNIDEIYYSVEEASNYAREANDNSEQAATHAEEASNYALEIYDRLPSSW